MPGEPRVGAAYGGWLQSYEKGLLSRRDGAIRVTLPESEEQLTLAEYNPARVRTTTELDLLPAPQRVSRLRNWLDHERPPPKTPEPAFASYDDISRNTSYHAMTQAVRGSSLQPAPTSECGSEHAQHAAASRVGTRGGHGRSNLPGLRHGAALKNRRHRRRRSELYSDRPNGLQEHTKWKVHAGYDPLMSTTEILALGALDDSEEQLVQSVMSQQKGDETFCTWLLGRPMVEAVLDNPTKELQTSLDSLADAAILAVERRSRELQVRLPLVLGSVAAT